jgi:hypothetical protein
MGVRMIIMPKNRPEQKLPMIADPEQGKPTLPWTVKFGQIQVADSFTTALPDGGKIMHLKTAGQTFDVAWLGDPQWKDYHVEAWVYCNLRTELKKSGWERVGIFAHDNGQHAADTKNEVEIGSSIAMMFDSDDGSLRVGDVLNGSIGDYRGTRYHIKESGWHKFAITCQGNTVTYGLDGQPLHVQENVKGHPQGECGISYNSAFDPKLTPEQGSQGIYFSGFKVTGL